MKTVDLLITPDGSLEFIYEDGLRNLLDLGPGEISRASHVEPTTDGRWSADLSPVGGPTIGPFDLRQDAIEAEIQWLREHLLGHLN